MVKEYKEATYLQLVKNEKVILFVACQEVRR